MASFFAFLTFDNFLFVTGMVCFFVMLIVWHFSSDNTLDFKTLLVKNNEISLSKLGQLVALLVSTWIIIYQTRQNLLTEWLFTGYMIAWSGASLVSKWIDKGTTNNSPIVPRYGRNDSSISVPRNDREML